MHLLVYANMRACILWTRRSFKIKPKTRFYDAVPCIDLAMCNNAVETGDV